jgi:hypothetical protein
VSGLSLSPNTKRDFHCRLKEDDLPIELSANEKNYLLLFAAFVHIATSQVIHFLNLPERKKLGASFAPLSLFALVFSCIHFHIPNVSYSFQFKKQGKQKRNL